MPFLRRLAPVDSLGEILFGLIMVLTFTLGAGVAVRAGEDEGTGRELIYAAIGCNIAWGIIDAALYVMSAIFSRNRRIRLARAVKAAADTESGLAAIRAELDPELAGFTRVDDRERLYEGIFALIAHAEPRRSGVTRNDMHEACAVFVLVVATAVPAIIPFLLVEDTWLALRLSNLLLVGLLFVVGFRWARHTDANPWLSGVGVMLLGVVMVAIAIPLGG